MTLNLTQRPAANTQEEQVTWVPASLVTTTPSGHWIPLPPPPRGFMLPTRMVLPATSTEHIAEALKEVMLELEPMAPTMKKYRKYLQRQNVDDDITMTRM